MTAPSCHSAALRAAHEGSPTIALVGAPNSGKSTLFNALTGARVHMGNWPGTSVEVSRGAWSASGREYDVIDFPGAYSLDPASPDEEFTRRMVLDCATGEGPDLIVAVLDAANIARGLYMVAQLTEQHAPVVIALTKLDVARRHGIIVDPSALEEATGCEVIAINPRHPGGNLALLERALVTPRHWLPAPPSDDAQRFAWIHTVLKACVTQREVEATWTERIDRVALHRVAGPAVFLSVMWSVFQVTTTVAAPFQDFLDGLFSGPLTRAATRATQWAPHWVQAFLTNGLIAGVGAVLTFVPLMALMFMCLALLEDSGYMARAAVITDRVMKSIGLPGKAFIPLVVGFGCNVPAIAATRILSHRHHRIMTALLVPFTSCTARLTVYVMLAHTFFPEHSGTVVFTMYLASIGLVVLAGLLLRLTVWRNAGAEPLIIDLPDYQLPGARLVFSSMWTRLQGFLRTASGIIVACVIAVFLLQSTPVAGGYGFADENLRAEDSAYAAVAEAAAPVFEPAGFGTWSLTGPLIIGFLAKEAVISTWAQTYAVAEPSQSAEQIESPLAHAVRADFNAASGGNTTAAVWAYLIFLLAYAPCVATVAAQRREIGWKWTLFGMAFQFSVAWVLAVAVFHVLKAVI